MKKVIALVAGICVFAIAAADNGSQVVKSKASPAAFTTLDKNADNQISKTEAGTDRILSNGFAYVDTNGDGFISRTEFLAQDGALQDAS
jgi:predicted nicotinamide N-methyase